MRESKSNNVDFFFVFCISGIFHCNYHLKMRMQNVKLIIFDLKLNDAEARFDIILNYGMLKSFLIYGKKKVQFNFFAKRIMINALALYF